VLIPPAEPLAAELSSPPERRPTARDLEIARRFRVARTLSPYNPKVCGVSESVS